MNIGYPFRYVLFFSGVVIFVLKLGPLEYYKIMYGFWILVGVDEFGSHL